MNYGIQKYEVFPKQQKKIDAQLNKNVITA